MARFERKQNYVDGKVQGALVTRIMCHWLCFFVVTAFLFVVMQSMLGDPAVPLMERMAGSMREFALVAVIILAVLPAFALDTIRFSNRFAGPIFRVRRALSELSQHGTTEPIKFRDNDFWQEIALDVNRVIERVQQARAQEADLVSREG